MRRIMVYMLLEEGRVAPVVLCQVIIIEIGSWAGGIDL